MATTPVFGYELPTVGSDVDSWGDDLNSNWTALDADLASLFSQNSATMRPSHIQVGGIWQDTDTDDYAYYNGSTDIPLFNTSADEVAWYIGGATLNYLTDDGTDTLLYRASSLLAQANATRVSWYTGEMVVEGSGATLRLSDTARDGLANNSVDFDYDGSVLTVRSRDGGDFSIEELYTVTIGTDGQPDQHDWYIGAATGMALDSVGLDVTGDLDTSGGVHAAGDSTVGGALEVTDEFSLLSRQFEVESFAVGNNNVFEIDIGRNVFGGMLFLATNNASLGAEIFHFRASTPAGISQMTGNSNFEAASDTNLTGTTGGSGLTRVSSQTGGRLQIQNREGVTVTYCALVVYI